MSRREKVQGVSPLPSQCSTWYQQWRNSREMQEGIPGKPKHSRPSCPRPGGPPAPRSMGMRPFCAFEILPFSSSPFIQAEAVRKFSLETTYNRFILRHHLLLRCDVRALKSTSFIICCRVGISIRHITPQRELLSY